MQKLFTGVIALIALSGITAAQAQNVAARADGKQPQDTARASDGSQQQNPAQAGDGSRIRVTGTVVNPTKDGFRLDYGEKVIEVEVEGWNGYREIYQRLDGDVVTVSGVLDERLYQDARLEAESVYVDSFKTYFFADAAPASTLGSQRDDGARKASNASGGSEAGAANAASSGQARASADKGGYWASPNPPVTGGATVRGTVTKVDQDARTLSLDTGKRDLTVDLTALPYDPVDDFGFQKIREGDVVSVSTKLDTEFHDQQKVKADAVVTLSGTVTPSIGTQIP